MFDNEKFVDTREFSKKKERYLKMIVWIVGPRNGGFQFLLRSSKSFKNCKIRRHKESFGERKRKF